ncbi:MAG: hypothetical protein HC876_20260 [Chloroflexaceae bacterium]|nr:hypothetical protein [Chloroflexaceae bacterium]
MERMKRPAQQRLAHHNGQRQRGDGSVTQRKNGRWQGVIDQGVVDGKRKRIYVSGATEYEASAKLAALRQDIASGTYHNDAHQTLATYMTDWYALYAEGKVAAATCKLNKEQLEHHIIPGLGRSVSINSLRSIFRNGLIGSRKLVVGCATRASARMTNPFFRYGVLT